MRTLVVAALLAASATTAFAAPAAVTVTLSPEMQAKAVATLGEREVDDLAFGLLRIVERRLARTSIYDGQRIELVLRDVQPNRPTFKQLGDRPGLSYLSFGVGGAAIEGRAVAPDGAVRPLGFSYYETDVRYAPLGGTWADALWTFQRFASRLARGDLVASR
jgi:hypothetical protein